MPGKLTRVSGLFALAIATAGLTVSAYAGDPAGFSAPTAASRPAGYAPQFSVAKSAFGHYWIEDHGRRIALFVAVKPGAGYQIGLFRQVPGQVLDEKQFKDSAILDFVSLPGLRLDTNWISVGQDL